MSFKVHVCFPNIYLEPQRTHAVIIRKKLIVSAGREEKIHTPPLLEQALLPQADLLHYVTTT